MWDTAIEDLRIELSDGEFDRYHFRKKVFGEINASNTRYKTFEFRRVTDFTIEEGVYLNGAIIAPSGVIDDHLHTGEFILREAPLDGDFLEASYYTQWFLDQELVNFLEDASRWLLSHVRYESIPQGLIPAAIQFAASQAYAKMSQRWRSLSSETYRVEDTPGKDANSPVESFINLSKIAKERADQLRDDYYRRQGKSLQPLFGVVSGKVRNLP